MEHVNIRESKETQMEWFKKHTDLIIMLSAFASAMLWMNGKFNDIEKDIAVIKTVLVLRNIMPAELAKKSTGE